MLALNFLFEELALGLATWAEKPLKAACLSRASNKKAILTDGRNPSWGLGFDVSRGDRIRTCGILLLKQHGNYGQDRGFPVVDPVLAVFLRHDVSAGVTSCLTLTTRSPHNMGSSMPLVDWQSFAIQSLGSSPFVTKCVLPQHLTGGC